MKITYFKTNQDLNYPVGEHINSYIKYIDDAIPFIKQIIGTKDINILCTGSSGAILAALVASKLSNQSKIIHVKKPGEKSHTNSNINDAYKIRSQLFNLLIDDFVSSGESVNRILKALPDFNIDLLFVEELLKKEKWLLNSKPKHLLVLNKYTYNFEN